MQDYTYKKLIARIAKEKAVKRKKRQAYYQKNRAKFMYNASIQRAKRKETIANNPELQKKHRAENARNSAKWLNNPENRALHNSRNSQCQKRRKAKLKAERQEQVKQRVQDMLKRR